MSCASHPPATRRSGGDGDPHTAIPAAAPRSPAAESPEDTAGRDAVALSGVSPAASQHTAPVAASQPAHMCGHEHAGAASGRVSSPNCGGGVAQPRPRLSVEQRKPAGRSPAQIAERRQKAEALREAMIAGDLTVAEAARAIGISERRGHKIATAYGLRASPEAVARRKAAFSAEAAKLGLQRSLEARRDYFARMSQAAVVAALGVSANAVARVLHGWRKPRPETQMRAPKPPSVPKAQKMEQRRIQRAEIAKQMRVFVERGMPVRMAGRKLGISRKAAERIATEHGIKADPLTLKNWRAANAARQRAAQTARRQAEQIPAAPAPANPRLSAAQQDNVRRVKAGWWKGDPRLRLLPPPSRDEADALVRDFLARRGATICPPAGEVIIPGNSGVGWR